MERSIGGATTGGDQQQEQDTTLAPQWKQKVDALFMNAPEDQRPKMLQYCNNAWGNAGASNFIGGDNSPPQTEVTHK